MGDSSFHIEIDKIDRNSWEELICQFDDASIYQTWAYGVVRRGARNVSHLVLKKGDRTVGCCQVTFRRLAACGLRIAYVVWGPVWRGRGSPADPDIFLQLIRAIKWEYAVRRGYLVRISPNVTGDQKPLARKLMEGEGLKLSPDVTTYRTLRLDLSQSLDDLRANLLQKWRNQLNKAEKGALRLVEGTSNELFQVFLTLVKQVMERKGFTPGVDYREFANVQAELPEQLKMRIIVGEAQGEPVCVAVCAAIGDTGIYLLGATGDRGRGLNGSNLLHWKMIEWLKKHGVRWYDLGGIDPQGNPGVFEFKLGLAGKKAYDEQLLGEFTGCFSRRAAMIAAMLKICSCSRQAIFLLSANIKTLGLPLSKACRWPFAWHHREV